MDVTPDYDLNTCIAADDKSGGRGLDVAYLELYLFGNGFGLATSGRYGIKCCLWLLKSTSGENGKSMVVSYWQVCFTNMVLFPVPYTLIWQTFPQVNKRDT